MAADWNPEQYGKFARERSQAFFELIDLVEGPVRRAVDLGCGPGELTVAAAQQLGCESMLGIDNSLAMLEAADRHANDVVEFAHGDIARFGGAHGLDLVLASASLQWVPDHPATIARWAGALAPDGQIAIQVPANAYMPSHRIADETARAAEFADAFGPDGPPSDPVADNVLEPEEYASVLYDLGFARQHVRLQIYPHVLPSSRDVVEWVRGTTLTRFQKRLDAPAFERFVASYEANLIAAIGDREPYFFPFRRILMWGRRTG